MYLAPVMSTTDEATSNGSALEFHDAMAGRGRSGESRMGWEEMTAGTARR